MANGTEPFELEHLAHQLIKIGVRIQAAAIIIAERVGTPTLEDLVETTEREAMHALDHWRIPLYGQRKAPWPWP